MAAEACKKKAKELLEIYKKTSNPDCLAHAAIYCFVGGGEYLKIFKKATSHYGEVLKKIDSLTKTLEKVDDEIEQLNRLIPSKKIPPIKETHYLKFYDAITESHTAIGVFKNLAKYSTELEQVRKAILFEEQLNGRIALVCAKNMENHKLMKELGETTQFNFEQLLANFQPVLENGKLDFKKLADFSNREAITQAKREQQKIRSEFKNIWDIRFGDMNEAGSMVIFAFLVYGLISLGDAVKLYAKK